MDNTQEESEGRVPMVTNVEPAQPPTMTVTGTLTSTGTDNVIQGNDAGSVTEGVTIQSLVNKWNLLHIIEVKFDTTDTVLACWEIPTLNLVGPSSKNHITTFNDVHTDPVDSLSHMGLVPKSGSGALEEVSEIILPTWSWAFNTATLYNGVPELRFTYIGPPSISHQLEIMFTPDLMWSIDPVFPGVDDKQIQSFVEWQVGVDGTKVVRPPEHVVAGARPTALPIAYPNVTMVKTAPSSWITHGDKFVQSNSHRDMLNMGFVNLVQRTKYYRPGYLPSSYFVLVEARWSGAKFYQPRAPPGILSVADFTNLQLWEHDLYTGTTGSNPKLSATKFMSYPEASKTYTEGT